MLAYQIPRPELINACRTIFGSEVNVSIEFLRYLQPVGLKSAYRKRALETHPDRAKALGRFEDGMSEKFREVRQAYEMLHAFLEGNYKRIIGDAEFNRRRKRRTPSNQYRYKKSEKYRGPSDHFYRGSLPKRKLLLGQFLYYSGIVSWRTLIEAISWQRKQRPKIGQIAVDWEILTPQDIMTLLTRKPYNEKFGECALRMGYITGFEHIALIGKQRELQRRIGEYFIKKGTFSAREISQMVNNQRIHNINAFMWK